MDLDTLIQNAKTSIEAIIQRPKMTEKLLSKPPFRFLHDIISAVTTATGFANGLYDENELASASLTEKNQKLAYLEKIFKMGAPLDIRAAKVLGGLEPENTCMFLVDLSQCATDSNVDSEAAVRRTLGGEEPGAGPAALKKNQSTRSESKADSQSDNAPSKQEAPSAKSRPDEDNFRGIDAKRDDFDMVAPERGKSRGGTRGTNRPAQQTATTAGLNASSGRPPNLDAEIEKCDGNFEVTKELVGGLISKPKMTDQLLAKPPFRFLFDIINEIIRVTGFAQDLYTEDERNSNNVKEKEQKIAYLDKILNVVGIQLNTLVEAKSAKIVAGLLPQDTNRFLQLLAIAAKHMPDSTNAVRVAMEQFGGGEEGAQAPPQMGLEITGASSSAREREIAVERAPPSQQRAPPAEEKVLPERTKPEAKVVKPTYQAESKEEVTAPHSGRDDGRENGPMEDASDAMGGEDGEKKSMRPTTARRRPPKVKDATREVTAKETAPSTKKAEGILIDGQGDEEDEEVAPEEKRLADMKGSEGESDRNQQSKLVQDILSRQAEQEASSRPAESKTETKIDKMETSNKDGSGGIRLGQLRSNKKGATGAQTSSTTGGGGLDIQRLRKAVQTLVQHTGPLGTCMDYIQEDVGTMAVELHRWEDECRRYDIEVENQKKKTQEKLGPLNREFEDLDEQVKDQLLKLSIIKANIVKNEQKIQSILRLAATS